MQSLPLNPFIGLLYLDSGHQDRESLYFPLGVDVDLQLGQTMDSIRTDFVFCAVRPLVFLFLTITVIKCFFLTLCE